MLGPEFRRSMACGEAKGIWKRYGFATPNDLVLEDLAMAMGVVVLEDRLDSADARLLRKGSNGIIRVNREITQPGRKRFAIAHEIGHWLLHESVTQILACTQEDMRIREYKTSEPEVEANWFAAELLMPTELFGARCKNRLPTLELIDSLASEFNISRTAGAVRFVELSKDYCALIVCKDGRIQWWRVSQNFEDSVWITRGMPVSHRTLAGQHYQGRPSPQLTQPVGMSEWAERWPDFAEEAIETLIPLGQTGMTLTLLWLR